ncbi:MAG: outer membrane lipoprotein-sorting protein [Myxococcota bacterium]
MRHFEAQMGTRLAALALMAFFLQPGSAISADPPLEIDAAPPSPESILKRAFENQYDVNTTSIIELVMHNRSGQTRQRKMRAAQKIIGDRVHAIGRLTYPEYLRDMAILQIEEPDHTHNAFIYMPSLRKVRRVTTSQRGDAFFGTDITYEDIERRYIDDYEVLDIRANTREGEDVYVIRARPVRRTSYAEVVFSIAQSDDVILGADYYKRDAEEPFRTLALHREGMIEEDGHKLATRITVKNVARGTRTEVTFRDLKVNPEIDDRLFSVRTLDQERQIHKGFD